MQTSDLSALKRGLRALEQVTRLAAPGMNMGMVRSAVTL